ncbi:hypothetical protein BJ138DRAFT_826907 [Hygrophoropsis aurantiaca]|uniref:Uncharacterized protein n=1 Tax=Hygrophoropsis aurantiaca TaxID=72124 RepID=A0ACB8ART0_9AGAM|nr:hypothetical protein BJ138DRAFT_826907 [Hygrophoropsis aurantiaca]
MPLNGVSFGHRKAMSTQGDSYYLSIRSYCMLPKPRDIFLGLVELNQSNGAIYRSKPLNPSANFVQMDRAAGKSAHRKHGHMHTQLEPGIDISVAINLKATFAWVPPLAAESHDSDDYLGGPESIAEEELDQAFDKLDRKKAETAAAAGVSDKVINNTHGVQLQAKSTIGWNLNECRQRNKPVGFNEEINLLSMLSAGAADAWDVGALMTAEDVTSLL